MEQSNALLQLIQTGTRHHQAGDLPAAEAIYQQVLDKCPAQADTLSFLGLIRRHEHRYPEALLYFKAAMESNPLDARFPHNCGLALLDQGLIEEALPVFLMAEKLAPEDASIQNSIGTAYCLLDNADAALPHYLKAIAFAPDHAEALKNLGLQYHRHNALPIAINYYQRAIAAQPDYVEAHWNYAYALLADGDYTEGWKAFEWRWHKKEMQSLLPPTSQPTWTGERFEGKTLLIFAEQGLGDNLQFIRFAKQTKARGGTVLVWCQEPLKDLFSSVPGVDAVIGEYEQLPPFDLQIGLLSLGQFFIQSDADFDNDCPYFTVQESAVLPWLTALPKTNKPRVGINWAGNPAHQNDHRRTCPLTQFESLMQQENIELISIQKELRLGDKALLEQNHLLSVGEQLTDFNQTAGLLSQLDLVITVDTAVAHLAGALNRPTWVLLPFTPDWRWLMTRQDSPWYPSVQLFRQPKAGDWDSVLKAVLQQIKTLG